MSNHTPPPWAAGTDCVFADDHRKVICTTWGVGGPADRTENDANNRLIATTPDLLIALIKLSNEVLGSLPLMEELARREFGNTNYNVMIQRAEEARAAIAKAEGRS